LTATHHTDFCIKPIKKEADEVVRTAATMHWHVIKQLEVLSKHVTCLSKRLRGGSKQLPLAGMNVCQGAGENKALSQQASYNFFSLQHFSFSLAHPLVPNIVIDPSDHLRTPSLIAQPSSIISTPPEWPKLRKPHLLSSSYLLVMVVQER